jgi:hypothetical protein
MSYFTTTSSQNNQHAPLLLVGAGVELLRFTLKQVSGIDCEGAQGW